MKDLAKHFLDTALEINTHGFFDVFVKYAQHENRILDLVGRSKNDPLLPSVISEKLGLSRVTVTLTLNALEKDGLIERTTSKTDRRKVLVHMTAKGRNKLKDTHELVLQYVQHLFELLGDERTQQLVVMMELIEEKLSKGE